jgi:hypothetical protein
MVRVLTFFFYFVHHVIFNEALCFESRLCFRLQAGKSPNLMKLLELFSVTGLSLSEDGNTVLH